MDNPQMQGKLALGFLAFFLFAVTFNLAFGGSPYTDNFGRILYVAIFLLVAWGIFT